MVHRPPRLLRHGLGCGIILIVAGCGAATAPDLAPAPTGANAHRAPAPPPLPTDPVTPAPKALPRPPPISGGTLTVLRSGTFAVAADPDRDCIFVVDLVGGRVAKAICLPAGSEPGRVVEDGAGRVHVVLRGGGGIVTLDGAPAFADTWRGACALPRGIAHDPERDALFVACAGGELVELPASGGAARHVDHLDDDLRDVVVVDRQLYVSRFRSAQILVVDLDVGADTRAVVRRVAPAGWTSPQRKFQRFEPEVAWRMVENRGQSGVVVAHQRAFAGPVEVLPNQPQGGYNPPPRASCDTGVVQSVVAQVHDAQVAAPAIVGAVLPVDVALSPTRPEMMVVAAGGEAGKQLFRLPLFDYSADDVCGEFAAVATSPSPKDTTESGQVTAVAYLPDGDVAIQTREPATLRWGGFKRSVLLDARPSDDLGHHVFHADSGKGIACASCHPEGGDDGRSWSFGGVGMRRTPSLRGGILGTAPFHWDGDLPTFEALVHEVLERRMGAPRQPAWAIEALGAWVDGLPRLPRATGDAEAVARGAALFRDPVVGCAGCHAGPRLTDNRSVDVGTGGKFQVPPLLGVGARLPLLHDGCAATLRDRFGPCGGGDRHGRTSQLSPGEIDDLVAYLDTL